ncbi:MAG: EamA family transporter [Candidatus Aenigmarchaeota archaeon]|nr:EamA family transporter [Candidatus Aenigmarchaeota archaeon]
MVDILPVSLAVIATVLGATASIFFKLASKKVHGIKEFLHNKEFFAGGFLFAISTLFMISALKFGELSEIFPLTALTYIWVAILSVRILKENMSAVKIAGFMLIILGILFVAM